MEYTAEQLEALAAFTQEEQHKEQDRLLLLGIARDPAIKAPTLDAVIINKADFLNHNDEARMRMQLARAAGISYPQAMERWGDADSLTWEMAYNLTLAESQLECCPSCGIDPADMEDENGILANPRWKFVVHDCGVCETVAEYDEKLNKRKNNTSRIRVVPRQPGEPAMDPDDKQAMDDY